MSGGIELTIVGDDNLAQKLQWLAKSAKHELLEVVGAEVESQTRRRITHDKSTPNGFPWLPWSPRYAKTRHAGQSLLEGAGHLRDSIEHAVEGDEVVVGSGLRYAAIHQFGGWDIDRPWMVARPYLGLSRVDEEELSETIEKFFQKRLAS